MQVIRVIEIVLFALVFSCSSLTAQSFTFSVDNVVPTSETINWEDDGNTIASELQRDYGDDLLPLGWKPTILANSFANDRNLHQIGQDVLFQMLLRAWCQHRPVVLTPDAVWMVIAQGLSHYINEHPEAARSSIVNHTGKQSLVIETTLNLLDENADWEGIISGFVDGIDKYTNNIASTLVADFSTTGINERIASEITLMDVVKPYFEYEIIYAVCGIPSITLTGTSEDWIKVLEKTQSLRMFNLGWWADDLEPILRQFIRAAQGNPDVSFWQDIVRTRPVNSIKGPVCAHRQPKLTQFDGWFLKLFPFDSNGLTPSKVSIMHNVLPETVRVPFKYVIVDGDHDPLHTFNLELVAGIVCVQEDSHTFTLTPKIGWFVRTTNSVDNTEIEHWRQF